MQHGLLCEVACLLRDKDDREFSQEVAIYRQRDEVGSSGKFMKLAGSKPAPSKRVS
jgi:hypothetical protein